MAGILLSETIARTARPSIYSSTIRFLGEVTYLTHHKEGRPDREGNWRDAFVFELEIESANETEKPSETLEPEDDKIPRTEPRYWSMSPTRLRDLAERVPPATTSTVLRRQVVRQRSEAVRVYVLRRADGVCEGCGSSAPFMGKKRRPYLEPHHIYRIADGGPDHPAHVIALCPNCHRRVHHGIDGAEYNKTLASKMGALEPRKLD
ncbi:MAG: 5-methylcytosine-specific restriction protein A [Gammaproteobacteria bacterium]|jgi:5-methylcytosine-specific restriction protein A